MTKTMNRISKIIITGACALFLIALAKPYFSDSQPFLNVDPKDVLSLENKVSTSINMFSLIDHGSNAYLNNFLFKESLGRLSKRGKQNLEIPILIDSYGGAIGYMGRTAQVMSFTRMLGIKYKCYVSNAVSAAFFILVTQCDKRIVLKGARVGQHPVHVGSDRVTADSLFITAKMSRAEAKALGQPEKKWYDLTRGIGKLKEFDEEEMLEYGIATEIYERPKSSSK